jgi:23S rRNA pseudoU1915 N3-methylase RlmH
MNAEQELKHIVTELKDACEKKDAVIKRIEEEFQNNVNEFSEVYNRKHSINILNIYKVQSQDVYKVQISFEEEPEFLKKLKQEIFYLQTGGKQIVVNFNGVSLYWMNYEGVKS